jgi:adenylate cyclase
MGEATRRLAGILVADVVGYSAMMAADEASTMARVRALRSDVIEPLAAEHRGRIFKTTGDGFLVEFASAVQALRCAISIQEELNTQADGLRLRIGVHQGEVVQEGDDLLGSGVIVASRIEPLADPGGICISGRVREDAAGKVSLVVEGLGTPTLKNIAQPVQVFRVRLGEVGRPALPLPDRPSIAVLPFQNMSGDPEQEYFADGMVEEIITGLSRVRSFFVIARNSSFAYKGKSPDVRQVGRELGVRYVLEGSVRKAGNRVRITGQLIDATTGTHLWADRFDGALEDIFELQDSVTASVVGVIQPTIVAAEIERAQRKPTESLQAYDLVLRALPYTRVYSREGYREAVRLLRQAVDIDPHYGRATVYLAWFYWLPWQQGWPDEAREPVSEITRLARLAVQLGSEDAEVLTIAGFLIAIAGKDVDEGLALAENAIALDPNSAVAQHVCGQLHAVAGDAEAAIGHLERALRINPHVNPQGGQGALSYAFAVAHFVGGRYADVLDWTAQGLRTNPGGGALMRIRAASLGMLGRVDEGHSVVREVLAMSPDLTISYIRSGSGFKTPSVLDAYCEGLRRAGLPE